MSSSSPKTLGLQMLCFKCHSNIKYLKANNFREDIFLPKSFVLFRSKFGGTFASITRLHFQYKMNKIYIVYINIYAGSMDTGVDLNPLVKRNVVLRI